MQILKPLDQLVTNLTHSVFPNTEITRLQIIKQVGAIHIVENNVVALCVFEDIHQRDNIRVLAHLEDLNLSLLLDCFDVCHIFLLNLFDSDFLTSAQMSSIFD